MFHVYKAKKGMHIKEVPLRFSSLNQGDCFILEAEGKLYIWQGSGSSVFEKNKAIYFGNSIKNHDYKGGSEIEIITGDEQNQQFNSYLEGTSSEIRESIDENLEEIKDEENQSELNLY